MNDNTYTPVWVVPMPGQPGYVPTPVPYPVYVPVYVPVVWPQPQTWPNTHTITVTNGTQS